MFIFILFLFCVIFCLEGIVQQTTYNFFQEYKDFKSPNNNRIYISYLDSVQFLDKFRSKLYNELMLGYFKYCGELGLVNQKENKIFVVL